MIAGKRSFGAVVILWLCHLELGTILPAVQALTSLSSSSAATTSPLFRACPPPQGPQDQHQQQQQQQQQFHHLQHRVLSAQKSSSNYVSQQPKVDVEALQALGYPEGFCRALVHGATQVYAKRYWIIDDSLSMSTKDGHFLLYTPQRDGTDCIEQAPCTRWNELQETVLQHALLAHHLDIPTDFRLLNHAAGHFRIPRTFGSTSRLSSSNSSGNSSGNLADVQHAQKILSRTQPRGVTPLTARLRTVHKELEQSVLPKLPTGQKVALVLATDGLPTNVDDHGLSTQQAKEDFRQALLALPAEQVSIVIRLCTDDVDVVSFYNQLETTLPHVQVLDDYWAEAARAQRHNPWLNYGLVLHRIREMACCGHVPLLKVLSQRPLTVHEVAEFCAFLFDWQRNDEFPASLSWESLVHAVQVSNAQQEPVWNPVSAQLEAWVDLDKYHIASA